MNHNHTHCQHDIHYCEHCDCCYCTKCNREWGKWFHYYYPYYYPNYQQWWYTSLTPTTGTITVSDGVHREDRTFESSGADKADNTTLCSHHQKEI